MKEIKFRAYQDNQMLYSKGSGVYEIKYFLDKLYEDCELMQYIGLIDKNGKEIYEGDIIKAPMRCEDVCYVIIFNNGVFYPENDLIFTESCFTNNSWQYRAARCEVIGNIYENPELIKE